MKISKAVQCALEYHRANSRENTVRSCEFVLSRFDRGFEGKDLDAITSDDVLSFLGRYTEDAKQSTKRSRRQSYIRTRCLPPFAGHAFTPSASHEPDASNVTVVPSRTV